MSSDTIVRWSKRARPRRVEIRQLLVDYVGSVLDVEARGDRYFVILGERMSFSYRRVGPATETQRGAWRILVTEDVDPPRPRPRFFEVIPRADYVYVTTRMADEFTCAVADGFVAVLARAWGGKVER